METKEFKYEKNFLVIKDTIIPYGERTFYARTARIMGTTDVLLIFDEIPTGWHDMANTDTPKGNDVVVNVDGHDHKKEDQKKEDKKKDNKKTDDKRTDDKKTDDKKTDDKKQTDVKPAGEKKFPWMSCLKAIFIILGILSVVVAIALIIVAILTSIATRAYDADQSSRVAAMVLLAVTGALTICMVIYLEVSTFKKHSRPMIGACIVILILAIVQALIGGISVNVSPSDEAKLLRSLSDSFKLAKEDVSRHYKLWAMTQYDLNCCGVYGPDDYRMQKQPHYFPPDVPVSCCPGYDPDRSDLVQEKERKICTATRNYYSNGCKDLVLMVFNETATIVLTVNIILIVAQLLLLMVGIILWKKLNQNTKPAPPK